MTAKEYKQSLRAQTPVPHTSRKNVTEGTKKKNLAVAWKKEASWTQVNWQFKTLCSGGWIANTRSGCSKKRNLQGSTTAMAKNLKILIWHLHTTKVQKLQGGICFHNLLDPWSSITPPILYQQIKLCCPWLPLQLELFQVFESIRKRRWSYGVAIWNWHTFPCFSIHLIPLLWYLWYGLAVIWLLQIAENAP